MTFLARFLLTRVLPHTLPIVTRTVMSTGIVSGIYGQPLYRLLPLFLDILRRGNVAWVISPLATLVPQIASLSFPVIKRLILSAVFYRAFANTLILALLYPIRLLIADILLMPTGMKNLEWYKDLNKVIYANIKSFLVAALNTTDTVFSFTIDHGWFAGVFISLAGICLAYYKYEQLLDLLTYFRSEHPNLCYLLTVTYNSLLHSYYFIGGSAYAFYQHLKPGFINSFVVLRDMTLLNIWVTFEAFVSLVIAGRSILKDIWEGPIYLFKKGFNSLFRKFINLPGINAIYEFISRH